MLLGTAIPDEEPPLIQRPSYAMDLQAAKVNPLVLLAGDNSQKTTRIAQCVTLTILSPKNGKCCRTNMAFDLNSVVVIPYITCIQSVAFSRVP